MPKIRPSSDLRNNYNNTYVYFVPSSGKAIFMQFDLDRGLGQNGNWDPTGNSMTEVTPYSSRAYGYSEDNNIQRNNLYRYTIMDGANSEYRNTYKDYINEVISDGWMSSSKFDTMYQDYRLNYQTDVIPHNELPYVPFSLVDKVELNYTFSEYTSAKLNVVATYL